MNFKITLIAVTALCIFSACVSEDDANTEDREYTYFLSDIRPRFFEQLNFNSQEQIKQIPDFLTDFTRTYNQLELEYQEGRFQTDSDLEYMTLVGNYYSFLIVAVVRAYMDGILSIEDIIGDRNDDFFSSYAVGDPNFDQKELEEMMKRAEEIAYFAVHVNDYNDRSYGFFLAVRQVYERLRNPDYTNDPIAQDAMIYYSTSSIENYEFFFNWNVLMSMVTLNNYADDLNTFQNPKMNIVLNNLNERLLPGAIIESDRNYTGLLGPMYRFDLLMKKIDHMIHLGTDLSAQEIEELEQYINGLVQISGFIENEQSQLLDSWEFTETFFQRKEKMQEIQTYFNAMNHQEPPMLIPDLSSFLKSRDFNQAYQCYSCHQSPKSMF